MRKRIIYTLIITAIICYGSFCTGLFFFPKKTNYTNNTTYLLTTNWQQMGGFQTYTPDSLRTGCWSTALAQIVNYHKLQPKGIASYTSRKGFVINQKLDSINFNLNTFTSTINTTTPTEVKNQMALYNFYAACAVQKDFGTDSYMNKLAPASLFEQHYAISCSRYLSWRNFGPYTLGKLEQVIYTEINNKRPVLLHFSNLKNYGHSVVVDGFYYKEEKMFVHTNQGQGGGDDGWYEFKKGIIKRDDNALRVIYTFKTF